MHSPGRALPAGAQNKGKNVLQPDELAVLSRSDTTTFNRQRVPDP